MKLDNKCDKKYEVARNKRLDNDTVDRSYQRDNQCSRDGSLDNK